MTFSQSRPNVRGQQPYFVESDVILDVGRLVLGLGIVPGWMVNVRTSSPAQPDDSPCDVLDTLSGDIGRIIRGGSVITGIKSEIRLM